MKRILFFFVDGVGIGERGDENPLSTIDAPTLHRLAGHQQWCAPFSPQTAPELVVRSLDATLGVEGLPQSGTGQATLFTGTNCAEVVGRHFGPFPHSKTHPVLDRANLFCQLQSLPDGERPGTFANAFPPQYFDAARRRATVTTYCCKAASIALRDLAALRDERAVAADLTSASWKERLNLDVPTRSLAEAAAVLAALTRDHALTLFEYFLTDKVGHRRIDTPPASLLAELDCVLGALVDRLDPAHDALVVTSDHGNLENMSHTQHTRNPVPLVVYGWAAPFFTDARSLTDVTPCLVEALRSTPP